MDAVWELDASYRLTEDGQRRLHVALPGRELVECGPVATTPEQLGDHLGIDH